MSHIQNERLEQNAEEQGYDEGYQIGHLEGYKEGFKEGREYQLAVDTTDPDDKSPKPEDFVSINGLQ